MIATETKQDPILKTETKGDESSWKLETLKAYIDEMFHAQKEQTATRIEGVEKLMNTNFVAQEKAVATAFVAQEKAVATALAAQEKATNTAFIANEKALTTALASNKELNSIIQASGDKAITKAEDAQKTYNVGHNDLARKMEDQYKLMLPRTEADQRQAATYDKIDEHGKIISGINTVLDGMRGASGGRDKTNINLNSIITLLLALAAIVIALYKK